VPRHRQCRLHLDPHWPTATGAAAIRAPAGLSLALFLRLALLFTIFWSWPDRPLLSVSQGVLGPRLILLGRSLLVGKATHESTTTRGCRRRRRAVTGARPTVSSRPDPRARRRVLARLRHHCGRMARHIVVMVIAMVAAVGVMLAFAGRIGDFVNQHPSMKMLA